MKIKKYFTHKEVCQLSGLSFDKVANFIRHESVPITRIGRRIYFDLRSLIELKVIAELDLTPSQIREIRESFDTFNLSKTLTDKHLIIFEKSILLLSNQDDLMIISRKGKGQKLIGQFLLPDLYAELRDKARVLNIENYSSKFSLSA